MSMPHEDDLAIAPTAALQAHADGADDQGIPTRIRRTWEAASAEVSNLVFAAPDLYQRAMTLVGLTADRLRAEYSDQRSLLAFADRAEETAVAAARQAGIPTAGLRPDLIASAALAIRSREIAEERILRARLDRLAQAKDEGVDWVVVEEAGDWGNPLESPYRRVEVQVGSNIALLASAEPDETLSRAIYRLQRARLDPATGRVDVGEDPVAAMEQYSDHGSWHVALANARRRPS